MVHQDDIGENDQSSAFTAANLKMTTGEYSRYTLFEKIHVETSANIVHITMMSAIRQSYLYGQKSVDAFLTGSLVGSNGDANSRKFLVNSGNDHVASAFGAQSLVYVSDYKVTVVHLI